MRSVTLSIANLKARGVEVLPRNPERTVTLPSDTRLEAPCSLKWTQYEQSLSLGAFSYQVSGYCCAARIGRYCSFGENVQIGRQDHPTDWLSTSPAFYIHDRLFDLDHGFEGSMDYHKSAPPPPKAPTRVQVTQIGHDVWIGHGAMVRAGVKIGTGAIIAANAVVVKDVPPYAVVAGNPAVIKKHRLPVELIGAVLNSAWWRYAPWQLAELDISAPEAFVTQIDALQNFPAFDPTVISLAECA